jgi:hypothetical protein
MPGEAGQHVSTSARRLRRLVSISAGQLGNGRRGDKLFEEAVYKRVIRGRAQAAIRHQKAEMLTC